VLVDVDGRRFMTDVHTDAELAPRDVVARGIAAQMMSDRGAPVRLDCTHLGADFLARRFPNIDAACRAQGFDWATTPIPVTPAAHYYMGGIRTDEWGRTSLPGLFAVGEAACNGLHGANRLASNSLLEGAVYGTRAVHVLDQPWEPFPAELDWSAPQPVDLADAADGRSFTRDELQQLMWDAAGLSRDGETLAAAAETLAGWTAPDVTDAKSAEDANLLIVARAVVASALARRESRGGHYRTDFPDTDPAQARHSGVVSR
jgi:L-aspartate oxidase